MTKFQRRRRFLLRTILVLSLILTTLCGYVYAKYIKSETLTGSLTITADLGTVTVKEHEAVRQPDGSYDLDSDEEVEENTYILIPGLDIPKNPWVTVEKSNDIPVYVYVKIENLLPGTVTYTVSDDWLQLVGYNNVYVYCGDTDQALAVTSGIEKIEILKDNELIVSQKLNSAATSNMTLTFTAYMYQTAAGANAAAVYAYYNPKN